MPPLTGYFGDGSVDFHWDRADMEVALREALESVERMLKAEPEGGVRGTILFTGASAGVKGYPQSAPFAMGKFALRGLCQSLARELHPDANPDNTAAEERFKEAQFCGALLRVPKPTRLAQLDLVEAPLDLLELLERDGVHRSAPAGPVQRLADGPLPAGSPPRKQTTESCFLGHLTGRRPVPNSG